MTVTTEKEFTNVRTVTMRPDVPLNAIPQDLAGYMDFVAARLTRYAGRYAAAAFCLELAEAVKAGEKQALAVATRGRELSNAGRWSAARIICAWRTDAPDAATGILRTVWAAWVRKYGDSPHPPPLEGTPRTFGPGLEDPEGTAYSPAAIRILGLAGDDSGRGRGRKG
jgi:hypothetical protein